MKARKTPTRTCVACRRETDKRDLVRIARDADGYTSVDIGGKAPGRGAYVCAETACFELAISRKRLASALRATLSEEDVDRLRHEFEAAIDLDRTPSRSGR